MEEQEKKEPSVLEALKEAFLLICITNVEEIVKEGSQAYYDKHLASLASDAFTEEQKAGLKKLFIIVAAAVVEHVPIKKKDE